MPEFETESEASGMSSGEQQIPKPASLSRSQLASDIDEFRAALLRPHRWVWVAPGLAGLIVASTSANYRIRHGTTSLLQIGLFLGGIAMFLIACRAKWRHTKRIRAAFHAACPACGTPLLDSPGNGRELLAAEYAVMTGECGNCGATIVAD